MSELRMARALINWKVRQELDSVDIFDPASLDRTVDGPPCVVRCEDLELALDSGKETIVSGGVAPAMPWEIVL